MSTKYVDTFNRIATRAYHIDKYGNEYRGESLMLLLLMHCKGSRNQESVNEVAALLDDPNQK